MKNTILIIHLLFANSLFGQPVKVNPEPVDNSFDLVCLARLKEAADTLEKIFNSEEFAREVLHTDFNVGNLGLSNVKIYELILSGMDNYKDKPKDDTVNLRVKVFDKYLGHGNFGVTNMKTRITSTHRCFILKNNLKCYISHLAHEYMHQIGFIDKKNGLFGKKTKSVPYKIGNIIDKLTRNTSKCVAIDETCEK